MSNVHPYVGSAQRRVDGPLKVTGGAKYVAEFPATDLAYGWVVSSAIAKGSIVSIDTSAAERAPGVIKVFTHENRPGAAWFDMSYRDQVAPPGHPFRPLHSERILYSGQPIALVVAESLEEARHAATLLKTTYESESPVVDVATQRQHAYVPPKKRSGVAPPPSPRGDAEGAFASSAVKVSQDYRVAVEHHNPMEMHATTVVWEGDGKITVHDKTQGVQNTQGYVTGVFGLSKKNVQVHAPFIGGAFGLGLRPQHQLFLAVMATLELERSVRVTLTRDQMFTFGHRPDTMHTISLGADAEGRLQSIQHYALQETSHFEDYQENTVNWSGLMYACDNVKLTYELAKLDVHTPCDMRAPGATLGVYALESAMDELAYAVGVDPVTLRLINYVDRDQNDDKDFTSKELRACYRQGAERFGWATRTPEPRSMTDGTELVGYGMATGAWEAQMMKTAARAVLTIDGKLEVATATADIGTGTYTILSQIGADALGVPIEDVTALVGDSSLPTSPPEGGSWGAASAGSAVQAACYAVREQLLKHARSIDGSPLANFGLEHVTFENGFVALFADPAVRVSYADAMAAAGVEKLEAEETAAPDAKTQKTHSGYTHSAVFAEVRVDEELGVIRVVRIVNAVAGGRILNTQTARSQILGGVVMGIGMALHEESMADPKLGRFMNHNFGEYHIPANADIRDIDVIFVDEADDKASPLGVKGLGEIGIVGTAAAIANAIFHATGKRVRHLPITIDKLL